MSTEKFFDTIKDGVWHSLYELADQFEIPVEKLIEFSFSLSNQGIIQYQEKNQKIKIKPEWKTFFPDEKFERYPIKTRKSKIAIHSTETTNSEISQTQTKTK